ncbi:MAG TPA: condensation domain-containing protein, partial [Pseudonocardiaceae bacterium]
RVDATAAAAGVTPFGVYLGVFLALLHRWGAGGDLTVGVPVSVRRTRALRDLVGLLVNTVPVRVRFGPGATFADAVGQAARGLAEGAARAGYPFALMRPGSVSREPLCRISITLVQPFGDDTLADHGDGPVELFAGHTSARVPVPRLEGQFDVSAEIRRVAGTVAVRFRYDTGLFDEATVRRLLGHYTRLLDACCADPGGAVATAPLADAGDLAALLALGAG